MLKVFIAYNSENLSLDFSIIGWGGIGYMTQGGEITYKT